MKRFSAPRVYEFRSRFRAPLPFVYAWCTDYTPEDPRLEGEEYVRRILHRSPRKVVYEDLYDQPSGWMWSHQVVTLLPPNRWHAEAAGSHRHWSIDYQLSSKADGITELWFRGKRWATALAGRNPPKARLERELRHMWKNFGRALERDYWVSLKRREKRSD
jgi:hypothetical protein